MYKKEPNFFVRLLVVLIGVPIMAMLLIIIGACSFESFGNVMRKVGDNFKFENDGTGL